jgi:membrane-associated HD superfamily phosphohydrolase
MKSQEKLLNTLLVMQLAAYSYAQYTIYKSLHDGLSNGFSLFTNWLFFLPALALVAVNIILSILYLTETKTNHSRYNPMTILLMIVAATVIALHLPITHFVECSPRGEAPHIYNCSE